MGAPREFFAGFPETPRTMTMSRSSVFAAAAAMALAAGPAHAQVKWDFRRHIPLTTSIARTLLPSPATSRTQPQASSPSRSTPTPRCSPATAIKSAVRIGQAQVGEILISVHENEDPMFGIDVVLFWLASYDEARKLWLASRPAIERRLAEQGLMVLFAVPWPPQGIYAEERDQRGRRTPSATSATDSGLTHPTRCGSHKH